MIMSSRTIAWFFGSLLVVSWLVQLAALYVTGDIESDAIVPWLVGIMFIPTIWSISYLTFFNREGWKAVRFRLGNPLYLAGAALIPAAIGCSVLAVMVSQGWAASSYFDFSAGVKVLDGPWMMGDGSQQWAFFAANIAITAVYFASINSVAAFGEEFAWRGVMQHHLIGRFGFYWGVALLGFVWAIWHVPMNLAGYNHPDVPVLSAFILFPIEHIAISFIMACLTLAARSFWPAVLFHGSINGIQQGLMSSQTVVEGISPMTAEYLQIGLTVMVAVICVLLTPVRIRNSENGVPGEKPRSDSDS